MRRVLASWLLLTGLGSLAWSAAALTRRIEVHSAALPEFLWRPLVVLAVPVSLLLLAVAASGLTRNRGTLTHGLRR